MSDREKPSASPEEAKEKGGGGPRPWIAAGLVALFVATAGWLAMTRTGKDDSTPRVATKSAPDRGSAPAPAPAPAAIPADAASASAPDPTRADPELKAADARLAEEQRRQREAARRVHLEQAEAARLAEKRLADEKQAIKSGEERRREREAERRATGEFVIQRQAGTASPGDGPTFRGGEPGDPRFPDPKAAGSSAPTLPDFPWPPPRPSSQVVLDDRLFKFAQGSRTLAALNTQLENALRQTQYEYSYYRAPNGFALVTRLERIDADGTPQPEEFRFLLPGSREPFTLANYIRRLFFAPAGLYRLIVFVVTDQAFVASGESISPPAAASLLAQGSNRLSDDLKGAPMTSSHSVTALIYEFEKAAGQQDASTLTPGRLSANTHLQRARILGVLASR